MRQAPNRSRSRSWARLGALGALLWGSMGLPACGSDYAPIMLFTLANFPGDAIHVTVEVFQNGGMGAQEFFLSSSGRFTTTNQSKPPAPTGNKTVQLAVTVVSGVTGAAAYKVRADKVDMTGGGGGNMGPPSYVGSVCGTTQLVAGEVNNVSALMIPGMEDCTP